MEEEEEEEEEAESNEDHFCFSWMETGEVKDGEGCFQPIMFRDDWIGTSDSVVERVTIHPIHFDNGTNSKNLFDSP